jgi:tripartite-type tricarboxylate transporter receptor subunit TctC
MNSFSMRRRIALAAVAAVILPGQSFAQAWPIKPITLVVPFSPGAAGDSMARILAKLMGERYGHAFVVENKPGAGGNIGANIVFGAPSDGYTLLVPASNLSIAPFITKNLGWDPERDFAPIAMLATGPLFLAVGMGVSANSLPELIVMAKAQPGKVNYGSSGKGTLHHLAMTQLQQASGMELFHVPYKSIGDMINGLVGGQVQAGFAALGNVAGLAKGGKLKLLAVSAPSRLTQMPDVPTLRELGLAKAETDVWVGLFAPSKTPPEIVARLSREVGEVMKMQEYKDVMSKLGQSVPSPGNAEQMAAQLSKDKTSIPKLLQAAGISDSSN